MDRIAAVLKAKNRSMLCNPTVSLPRDFRFNIRRVVLIYPKEQTNPGFVASILGQHDKGVQMNSHWVNTDSSSSIQIWSGAVAHFRSSTGAKVAMEDIKINHKTLKVFSFKDIIHMLLKAEQKYPKAYQKSTKIIIRAANNFNKQNVRILENILNEFGKPVIRVEEYFDEINGVVAEAEYRSQFQAYAARIATHGLFIDGIGYLKIEVQFTESGILYDKFVKKCFQQFVLSDSF